MHVCYFYAVITSTYSVQNIFFIRRVQQLNLETVSEADWWVYINPFALSLFSFLYFYRIQQLVMESLGLGHSSTDWWHFFFALCFSDINRDNWSSPCLSFVFWLHTTQLIHPNHRSCANGYFEVITQPL